MGSWEEISLYEIDSFAAALLLRGRGSRFCSFPSDKFVGFAGAVFLCPVNLSLVSAKIAVFQSVYWAQEHSYDGAELNGGPKGRGQRNIITRGTYSFSPFFHVLIASHSKKRYLLQSLLPNNYGLQPRVIALIEMKTQQIAARSIEELEIGKLPINPQNVFRCLVFSLEKRHLSGLTAKKELDLFLFYSWSILLLLV